MPIAPVARKTRGFYAKDRTHFTAADCGHQFLKSGTIHKTGPSASEIIIDYADLDEAEFPSMID
jgi:hypothetical protein